MLFKTATLKAIAKGGVTLAFRRWVRPTVQPGGELRTVVGVLRFASVERIELAEIDASDARAAGFADRDALIAELEGRRGDLYRIEIHRIGDDPRHALRDDTEIDADTLNWIGRTAWAVPILTAIAQHPGLLAASLARGMEMERDPFKAKVRRLKDRGLTISLETGYRLSPRGEAVLSQLDRSP